MYLSFVLLVVLLMGTLMCVVEGRENGFNSIPVAVCWAITTMSTVGYGDIAPRTDLGRDIAAVMMLLSSRSADLLAYATSTREPAMTEAAERIAYHNGDYRPESQVRVPFRDRGFIMGDAVFDSTRTFGGKPFKLQEHVARLYDSLAYLRIDPRIGPREMLAISERVLEANRHMLERDEDYWITQRVSRGGVARGGDDQTQDDRPTVIVECQPLPFRKRAQLYVDGIRVVVPSVRRTPPAAFSPRAKTQNYLNLVIADLEAREHDPEAWAVLLDLQGNITEGLGSNIFLVDRGRLLTPRAQMVLHGITRATVFELAQSLGIPVIEGDFDLYDVSTASEAFLTSTSLCVCPISKINERRFADAIPGPVTARLMAAFSERIQFDYVAQYLAHRVA